MSLNLNNLEKSIKALEKSLTIYHSGSSYSEDLREILRAGIIQNFEVAYEQCWKFIQKWIRENRSAEDAEHPRTRKELFRIAARYGLISDPVIWFEYGDVRNLTSHTYDDEQANEAFSTAVKFLPAALSLLDILRKTND